MLRKKKQVSKTKKEFIMEVNKFMSFNPSVICERGVLLYIKK